MTKNKFYRQFLDTGVIELISYDKFKAAYNNVSKCNRAYIQEGKALLTVMYYTGARPAEILELAAKDITKVNDNYIQIQIIGKKGGLPRPIMLKYSIPEIKELYKYSLGVFPDMFLFYHYRNNYKRQRLNKKGIKEYLESTDKLRYYIPRWFAGVMEINPYFLRHNRFSKLANKGLNDNDLQFLKGSKTLDSIQPYKHLSTRKAKNLAAKID